MIDLRMRTIRPLVFVLLFATALASAATQDELAPPVDYGHQPIACDLVFIDQDRAPLAGVRIKATTWSRDDRGRVTEEKELPSLMTDAKGAVSIAGGRAGYLGLKVDDERYTHGIFPAGIGSGPAIVYRFAKNGYGGLEYAGSPGKPDVLQVWRKEGPQNLTIVTGELYVEYTGGALHLDLEKGELVDTGGDLIIEADMPKTDAERRRAADDLGWFPAKFVLRAVDGGLINLSGDAAEESKYAAGITAQEFPEHEISGAPLRMNGFVRLRNGKLHGRVTMAVFAEEVARNGLGRIGIHLKGALMNPTGSRSLETDATHLKKVTLTDARKQAGANGSP
jgi:hypothetical protein